MIIQADKRKRDDGRTEYWCRVCGVWTLGRSWNGTGYVQVICASCGATLVDDFYGDKEYENNRRKDAE